MTVNKASDWLIHNLGTVIKKIRLALCCKAVMYKISNISELRNKTFRRAPLAVSVFLPLCSPLVYSSASLDTITCVVLRFHSDFVC